MSRKAMAAVAGAILAVLFFSPAMSQNAGGTKSSTPAIDDSLHPVLYDFTQPDSRADWIHITSGDGNEFRAEGAHLTNFRGRAFMLYRRTLPRDLTVEVRSRRELGPAFAWILPRFKNANNYYEVVLKEDVVGVTRRYEGRYYIIADERDIDWVDMSATHELTVNLTGDDPTSFTVWIDGRRVINCTDNTGLGALDGRGLALETEASMATVESVGISAAPAALQTEEPHGSLYDFTQPESRGDWVFIANGEGNEFTDKGARMTNMRGRSFLLNLHPQPHDLTVEVRSHRDLGRAFAWIVPRYKDANNYYEAVLKENRAEVTRRHRGQYKIIAINEDLDWMDRSASHTLKFRVAGDDPASLTVWIDDRQVIDCKDDTGWGALDGDYLALETEAASAIVESVKIEPITNTDRSSDN